MDSPESQAQGKMIADLIRDNGYTQKEVAEMMNLTEDVIGNICRGITKLRGNRRTMLAAVLHMSDNDLRNFLQTNKRVPEISRVSSADASPDKGPLDAVNVRGKLVLIPRGMRPVPIYGSVPAGIPGRDFSDAEDVEFVPAWSGDWCRWGRFIRGDSMLDEFENGDRVIFEDRMPLNGQAVYATKEGEDTFKILRGTPDHGELWPLNCDLYEPFSAEGWEMHGILIQRVRYLRGGIREVRDYPTSFTFPHRRK